MPGQSRKKKYGLGKSNQRIELGLPSGETCLVIRPGVQGLIRMGILDSLDSLTSLVQTELIEAQDPRKAQKAVAALAERPEDLAKAMDLMDKVTECVVVEPSVVRPIQRDDAGKPILLDGKEIPLLDSERDDEVFYTDDVDIDDKMFIFQYVVGGTNDLQQFRNESAELLGGVPTLQDVSLPS